MIHSFVCCIVLCVALHDAQSCSFWLNGFKQIRVAAVPHLVYTRRTIDVCAANNTAKSNGAFQPHLWPRESRRQWSEASAEGPELAYGPRERWASGPDLQGDLGQDLSHPTCHAILGETPSAAWISYKAVAPARCLLINPSNMTGGQCYCPAGMQGGKSSLGLCKVQL